MSNEVGKYDKYGSVGSPNREQAILADIENQLGQTEIVTVYQSGVIIPHSEIITLPSTRVNLVPQPGAGKKIILIDAELLIDTTAGAYEADTNCRWQLFLGTREITGLAQPEIALTTPGVYSLKFPPFASAGSDGDINYLITSPKNFTQLVNQPLNIKDDYNGVANYTGGHADNFIKIIVTYSIISI